MIKKKVLVLGGGFGGIYVAKKLKKLANNDLIDLTLINRTNYFLFTPLLHEVATGGLSPISVAEPIRHIFSKSKIKFFQAEIEEINLEHKEVKTNIQDFSYDILVIATGADTRFYDIPGAEERSLTLKNLSDALKIRSRIIDSFEKAAQEKDYEERQKLLTFVVVGAGATGVELVAEISEFVLDTLFPFYCDTFCKKNEARVLLVSSTFEILTTFDPKLRNWAEKILQKKKVEVLRGNKVTEVSEGSVSLSNGQKINTKNVVWTAGVSPKLPVFLSGIKTEEGRIKVKKDLRIEDFDNIFALGDSAHFMQNNVPLHMFGQVTVEQSRIVAKNIKNLLSNKPLKNFRYKSRGDLISLGQWMAIGNIGGFKIKGKIAWWIWRTVYLFKFASWRKRFRIASEWTINLFFSRDTTKVN